MSTIVVALGGNALGNNVGEQRENASIAAKSIADLVEQGHNVVIVHGNGPQVGIIKKLMDAGDFIMPMPECTAMSQGYIGYHLSQSIGNELKRRKIQKDVACVLTQVIVSKDDPAFENPTKPIGNYYSEAEAAGLMAETGAKYAEDAGRGWRLVVPSPKPVGIVESRAIKLLADGGAIVIACGGGGMPVLDEAGALIGVDAVIDKDFAAAKLAEIISADFLFILTAVDRVKINFNKPNEMPLAQMTVAEAKQYIAEGHFAPGSMLPKVEAAMAFASRGLAKKAIISSLTRAAEAIKGKCGTIIVATLQDEKRL
ncbi:MAG: carbamate kinase [Clostridiales bacterium]|jgi:carbamate kinase|nr:carbamate kinase [Clostridiales bacterium]